MRFEVETFASCSAADSISQISASFSSMIESREGVAYLPWNHLAASGGESGDNGSAGVDVPVLVCVLDAAIARSGSSTMDRFVFLGA